MYKKIRKEFNGLENGEVARDIFENGIIYTTDSDRRIGKTTLILKIADILNKPIIVKENYQKRFYLERAEALGLSVNVLNMKECLGDGYNRELLYKEFLLDELSERDFEELQDEGFTLSGFVLSE